MPRTSASSFRASSALLLLALLIALLCAANARGEDGRVTLPALGTVSALKEHAEYLPVAALPQFDAKALSAAQFQPWNPAWDEAAPPMWVRLRVTPGGDTFHRWCLKIKRRFFARLDVYVLDEALELQQRYGLGLNDYRPGQIMAHEFVLPVEMSAGENRLLLMRVETVQQSLGALSFALEDELTLEKARNARLWGFGLYFGSVIALLVYNFMLYLNLRTPGHRAYVLTIGVVLLFMGMDTGLLQEMLPPAWRPHEAKLYSALAALMMAASIRFFQVFTGSRERMPGWHRALLVTVVATIALAVIALLGPLPWGLWLGPLTQLTISLGTFVLLASAVLASARGSSEAFIFTLAWSAFLAGSLVRSLVGTGHLPQVPAAEYMLYVGSVAEAMILALGLSLRVGRLRQQRERAEEERERAVHIANADMLTGLHNRRFLSSYLTTLFSSMEGSSASSALLLFDLDHFKHINDTYGHDAGDAALVAVADRCLAHLRDIDLICRLGGDEFAVVLGEVKDRELATQAAQRLHAAITGEPVQHGGVVLSIGISMGVLAPLHAGMAESTALKHADEALYAAKRSGRNRVCIYSESPPKDPSPNSEVSYAG